MATYLDLVREYFPNASDDELDGILWEKTAFPLETREDELRKQLAHFKRATELGRAVCSGCGKMRWPSQMKYEFCLRCDEKLNRARQAIIRDGLRDDTTSNSL